MTYNIDCPRGLKNCESLSNVVSDDSFPQEDKSFICVGYNQQEEREFHQDRFRHCVFSGNGKRVDHMTDADRRDLIEVVSVIGQALSIDENIRVYDEKTDEEMNETDLIEIIREPKLKRLPK